MSERARVGETVNVCLCVSASVCIGACQRVCVNVHFCVCICMRESLSERKREPWRVSEYMCVYVFA